MVNVYNGSINNLFEITEYLLSLNQFFVIFNNDSYEIFCRYSLLKFSVYEGVLDQISRNFGRPYPFR